MKKLETAGKKWRAVLLDEAGKEVQVEPGTVLWFDKSYVLFQAPKAGEERVVLSTVVEVTRTDIGQSRLLFLNGDEIGSELPLEHLVAGQTAVIASARMLATAVSLSPQRFPALESLELLPK